MRLSRYLVVAPPGGRPRRVHVARDRDGSWRAWVRVGLSRVEGRRIYSEWSAVQNLLNRLKAMGWEGR